MDRGKSIRFIDKMSKKCGIDASKSSLMLMLDNAEPIHPTGDQLGVKTELNLGDDNALNSIIDEHYLKFKVVPEKIVALDRPTEAFTISRSRPQANNRTMTRLS